MLCPLKPHCSAPAISHSWDSTTPPLCLLWGPSRKDQLLLFLCLLKSHRPCRASTAVPCSPGSSPRHLGPLLPLDSTPLSFLCRARPISCLGSFFFFFAWGCFSYMDPSLPLVQAWMARTILGPALRFLQGLKQSRCSEIPIHSFISAIMIHSEHLWSPCSVTSTALAFVVLSLLRGRQRTNEYVSDKGSEEK